jgi:hypothetical protein
MSYAAQMFCCLNICINYSTHFPECKVLFFLRRLGPDNFLSRCSDPRVIAARDYIDPRVIAAKDYIDPRVIAALINRKTLGS